MIIVSIVLGSVTFAWWQWISLSCLNPIKKEGKHFFRSDLYYLLIEYIEEGHVSYFLSGKNTEDILYHYKIINPESDTRQFEKTVKVLLKNYFSATREILLMKSVHLERNRLLGNIKTKCLNQWLLFSILKFLIFISMQQRTRRKIATPWRCCYFVVHQKWYLAKSIIAFLILI